jgi:hypothetical protein
VASAPSLALCQDGGEGRSRDSATVVDAENRQDGAAGQGAYAALDLAHLYKNILIPTDGNMAPLASMNSSISSKRLGNSGIASSVPSATPLRRQQ